MYPFRPHTGQSVAVLILLLTTLSHWTTTTVWAEESGSATLKITESRLSAFGSWEICRDGKVLATLHKGDAKEVNFTPSLKEPTKFVIMSYDAFGRKNYEHPFSMLIGPGGLATLKIGKDDDHAFDVSVHKAGVNLSNLKVKIEAAPVERELASEIVATPPGAKRTVKRSRTIERSVSMTDSKAVEASLQANLGLLSGEIRGKIEKSRSTTYRESETIEQAVELDGKDLPKAKLVWVERLIAGTATFSIDNHEMTVPFEFHENLELRVTVP